MSYDYAKLCGRIVERFGSRKAFAKQIGLSERSISLKLSGKIQWKQSEIEESCRLLEVPVNEIAAYFFARRVQDN